MIRTLASPIACFSSGPLPAGLRVRRRLRAAPLDRPRSRRRMRHRTRAQPRRAHRPPTPRGAASPAAAPRRADERTPTSPSCRRTSSTPTSPPTSGAPRKPPTSSAAPPSRSGRDTPNAAEQVTFIQTLTQQGVAAIAVSGERPGRPRPGPERSPRPGHQGRLASTPMSPRTPGPLRQLRPTPRRSAAIQVRIIARLIGCEGEIAILSAAARPPTRTPGSSSCRMSSPSPGYENIELVEIAYGDDEPQQELRQDHRAPDRLPRPEGHHLPDHRRHQERRRRAPQTRAAPMSP